MMNGARLYPEWIPIFDGEPTKHSFEKVYDKNLGWCIKPKTYFITGQLVARIYTGIIRDKCELHTVQKDTNVHIYEEWFAGLITHSCNSNIYFDTNKAIFIALKEIKHGDIITQDYELTEDYLVKIFECRCGSDNCRKIIKGRKMIRSGKLAHFYSFGF
jgi:hypothetical protein